MLANVQFLINDPEIQPLVEGTGINLTQGITSGSPLTNQRCIIAVDNCPISSITNLQSSLNAKQHVITSSYVNQQLDGASVQIV